MKNGITLILLLCVATLTYPMQEPVHGQGHNICVTEQPEGHKKKSASEAPDYLEELKKAIDFNLGYVTTRPAQKSKELAELIEHAKPCDELNAESVLGKIYAFGNGVRTIKDRVVILKDELERVPVSSETKILDNKLWMIQHQSYSYLQWLKEQLGSLVNLFPDHVRDKLMGMMLHMQSLSRADDIECALNKIGIRTKRVSSDGWFSADIGIFEHGKLLKGPRQQAIIERSPQFSLGLMTQDLRSILGEAAVKELAGDYKIHLMPKDSDLERVSLMLMNIIQQQVDLQNLVGLVKIKALLEPFVKLFINQGKKQAFSIMRRT